MKKRHGLPRFAATSAAGVRDGKRYAVVDRHAGDRDGMSRVSFHRTATAALREAKRLNAKERRLGLEGGT